MRTGSTLLALMLIGGVVAFAILGNEEPASAGSVSPVVRARVFELKDTDGQIRARLNVESGGAVVLRLMDESGTIRVKIGASRSGSGIVLLNDSTEVGVHLLAKDSGSSVTIVDKNGKQKVIEP